MPPEAVESVLFKPCPAAMGGASLPNTSPNGIRTCSNADPVDGDGEWCGCESVEFEAEWRIGGIMGEGKETPTGGVSVAFANDID